jgi:hypothetical protein
METSTNHAPETLSHLKPYWFHLLLSPVDHPQHGYGSIEEILDRMEGKCGFGRPPSTARSNG